jgi:competence protein ComEC
MRKRLPFLIVVAVALSCAIAWAQQRKGLDVYFIDVEGGQSTVFVTPSGQSLLVDTGWAGARDADRIAGLGMQAGNSRINYLVITTITVTTSAVWWISRPGFRSRPSSITGRALKKL